MRLLDSAGIAHRCAEYEVDESNLGGTHVAQQLGQNPDQVFKTLVLRDEKREHLVCCVPASCELDLKKVARAANCKRVEMIHVKELLPTTGYIRGGCSPIGMKKPFPTYIDETAQLWEEIAISAGIRGAQIIIEPTCLADFIHAVYADLCV